MTDTAPEAGAQTERSLTLQHVIDDLVATGPNHTVEELAARLVATLRERGLPAMPQAWIEAVAESAAAGNPYVVSRVTAEHEDVPAPATPTPPYGIE